MIWVTGEQAGRLGEIVVKFNEFRNARLIPGLDGLRGISVLLVLSWHTGDALWQPARGYLGVTLFFVISGFLITTLLLREEASHGRVSIWRFYVRRLFRITPMYYFTLLIYAVLVLGFNMAGPSDSFGSRVLLLATFNGEFAGPGAFSHAWSLGIEEKFYLLWPILGFAIVPLMRHRLSIAVGLLVLALVSAPFAGWSYLAIYVPIIAGVVLADLMHRESSFCAVAWLARPMIQVPILVALVWAAIVNDETTFVHIPFGLLATLAMPTFILGKGVVSAVLRWQPLAYVGRRAYGIYLVHIIVLLAVSRFIPESGGSAPWAILRFAVVAFIAVGAAEILWRLIESPMINMGRKLTFRKSLRDTPTRDTGGVPA
jgi:peptidoglycan/LPS O-acetylase OafA/YrhL